MAQVVALVRELWDACSMMVVAHTACPCACAGARAGAFQSTFTVTRVFGVPSLCTFCTVATRHGECGPAMAVTPCAFLPTRIHGFFFDGGVCVNGLGDAADA